MRRNLNQFRLLFPTAVTSLLLLVLGSFGGWYLYRQQEATAVMVSENLDSREAADDLDVVLDGLLALLNDESERVEPLHERIRLLLWKVEQLADKDEERRLSRELEESFERYHQFWLHRAGNPEWMEQALHVLETQTVPACRRLRSFNADNLEDAARSHRNSARWTAAGMAGLGILGATAGVLMGYGVARWLRKSIHQLRIRVQDAADKLGQDLPPVEWTEPGDLEALDEELHDLTAQVEGVVQTLHLRDRELWRSKQLAAAGVLATGIVHEIRNPLSSVRMIVQATREDVQPGTTLDDDLRHIEQAVSRIERSLQSFLEFARPPQMHRSSTDLVELMGATLGLIRPRARQQDVAVQLKSPATPLIVRVDRQLLQQAVLNLLLNALDMMPHSGSLTIEVLPPNEDRVEIRVLDTGPGIAADVLPQLFEPFVTSKETGVGLGLVVSQRIVEDHGGVLEGHNREEGGACFVIRIPVNPVDEAEHLPKPDGPP
jgi:C4-dicarboxylate-specific signal transduction histidine kinase